MTTTMLTPYDKGSARPAGRNLFRKQLLPMAAINYKGRVINFTRDYLAGLVKAFNDRAYDQVPFQLADRDNAHTEDPERFRGEIAALELTDDGLDVIVAATDDGARVLRENPRLGVSAKIAENYGRADGKFFDRAVKHVLGTLDPRLTGMSPWQAIEAANDGDGEVLDLTAEQYAPPGQAPEPPPYDQGGTLPPAVTPAVNNPGQPETVQQPPATEETRMALTDAQEARLARLLDLPDDQFNAVLATGAAGDAETLSDEELQALVDSLPDDPEPDPGKEPEPEGDQEPELVTAGAALSAEAQAQINLANSRAEETSLELARVTSALNRAAYERERDHFSREYGIPPRITDLARTVLEGEGHVVELSNGSSVDAGAIVRRVLKEIGQTVRMLDLSGELGTPLDFSADAEAAAEEKAVTDRQALVTAVRKMTGI